MAKRTRATAPIQEEEEVLTAVVIPPQDDDVPEAVVTSLKSTALQVISVTDAQLEAIEAAYGTFTIDGDQTRYKEAKQVKNKLVKVRTGIERKRKELNREFTDAVNTEAARVTARSSAVEQHLATEVTNYEEAEAKRIEQRIQHVTDRLKAAGFEFNGVAYECGQVTIWQMEVESITDEALESICTCAEQYRAKEAEIAAENARLTETVYLYHQESNELFILLRKDYEPEAQAYADSGVQVITKEVYEAIQASKMQALKKFAKPAAAAPPDPTPIQTPDPEPTPAPTPAPAAKSVGNFGTPTIPTGTLRFNREPVAEPEPAQTTSTSNDLDQFAAGWDQGYEAFRKQAVDAFLDPNIKRTRQEWIDWLKQLQPYASA